MESRKKHLPFKKIYILKFDQKITGQGTHKKKKKKTLSFKYTESSSLVDLRRNDEMQILIFTSLKRQILMKNHVRVNDKRCNYHNISMFNRIKSNIIFIPFEHLCIYSI